jgi:hypothetical protein
VGSVCGLSGYEVLNLTLSPRDLLYILDIHHADSAARLLADAGCWNDDLHSLTGLPSDGIAMSGRMRSVVYVP